MHQSAEFQAAEIEQMACSAIAKDIEAISRIDAVPQILEVICRVTGMGFAAVARVTEDRWVACAIRDEIDFGLRPGSELDLTTTICNEIRLSGEAVIIEYVDQDEMFRGHPTPQLYGFQSYVSVPITHAGQFFGTLCAVDREPTRLTTPETLSMFRLFADLIGRHLEVQDRLARSEAALLDARQVGELREQFIAVLSHDLRNPLAAIQGGSRLLLKTPLDEAARAIVGHVQGSVGRMTDLIDNLLDFARARLGGGFVILRRPDTRLAAVIEETVQEVRLAHLDRGIVEDIAICGPVFCDSARLAQLLSNLLGNAVVHGAPKGPITVRAHTDNDRLELSVSNVGDPIPAEAQARLFEPFSRADRGPGKQGLGLGLYIAAEIARAHGGELTFVSDAAETRFTFSMPLIKGVCGCG
jgi:hypothetical protein